MTRKSDAASEAIVKNKTGEGFVREEKKENSIKCLSYPLSARVISQPVRKQKLREDDAGKRYTVVSVTLVK